MTVDITANLHTSADRVRPLLSRLAATTDAPLDLSAIFRGILDLEDPAIGQLVAAAVPRGFTFQDAGCFWSTYQGKEEALSQRRDSEFTPTALEAIQECNRLRHRNIELDLELLMSCVLARFSPAERVKWQPLDVDKLLGACAQRLASHDRNAPVSSQVFTLPESVSWENLTERIQANNLPVPSPFSQNTLYRVFFERFVRALHRSSPRHVLLVRERGVGEQAVLLELVRRGCEGRPPFLHDKQFIAIDCRYIPINDVRFVTETIFSKSMSLDNLVLCIDGFVSLLRGRENSDRPGVFSLLVRSRCRVIGILSPHEYEELISGDADSQELFSIIHLHEPDPSVATELVRHYAAGLQLQYQLQIDEAAMQRAVALSASYILHERLPYKAVKILRAVCEDLIYEASQQFSMRRHVTEADIVAKVAEITGVPAETLVGVGETIDYNKCLSNLIVGQEHAVSEVATELGLIKAGFADVGKPASVMLFIGQTGTGKTEMAKALARFYSSSKRLKTFTLGNFCEPHSVSGIIGVPPGYVGHDQGGRLINELNADPYGVFLLDEADKAHPDVMQPFLNLFDEGWVVDQRGVKAYADRAIFILTTNVGQRQIADMCKSGKGIEEITATMKESLSRIRHNKSNRPVFSDEFLARVKRVVVFRSLDHDAMLGICQRLVAQLQDQWQVKRQKTLQIPSELVKAIAHRAAVLNDKSQGKEGGRIVRKLLADIIESRVQAAIGLETGHYRSSSVVRLEYKPSTKDDLQPDGIHVSPEQVDAHFDL